MIEFCCLARLSARDRALPPRTPRMLARTVPEDSTSLIARVAQGDRDAFVPLARQLYGPGIHLARRILLDPSEAEDAMQTALLKLWTRASQYDPARGPVTAWFRRLIVNACLDRRRSIRPVAPLDEAADAPAADPSPHARAETSDEAAQVAAAVTQLNPRQRAAIALFYGADASMTEVAEALETTPKAVEGLLARARQELSRILKDMRGDP